nr:hypothetical protein [Jannaschia sp. Os4]
MVIGAILLPMVLIPGQPPRVVEATVLIALFAGLFTLVEYAAVYPGLVEFRDAPPLNRVRFGILVATLLAISAAIGTGPDASTLGRFLQAVGMLLGQSIDIPYTPVRVIMESLPEGTTAEEARMVRMSAGLAYLISLVGLTVFSILIRLRSWPTPSGSFNVWVNLPTFDPTAGADVVARLRRDGTINVLLGLVLPYLSPPLMLFVARGHGIEMLESGLATCWIMTLWAFLPASLFLRGIALRRLALMIELKRRRLATERVEAEGGVAHA